jgi:hypothetical protein
LGGIPCTPGKYTMSNPLTLLVTVATCGLLLAALRL